MYLEEILAGIHRMIHGGQQGRRRLNTIGGEAEPTAVHPIALTARGCVAVSGHGDGATVVKEAGVEEAEDEDEEEAEEEDKYEAAEVPGAAVAATQDGGHAAGPGAHKLGPHPLPGAVAVFGEDAGPPV